MRCAPNSASFARRPAFRRSARQEAADLDTLRGEVERVSLKLGRRIKFLVGKPGLDGHSNGAEQIAARATDAGMDVVYDGIRFTPGRDRRAREGRRPLRRPVDPVGLACRADRGGARRPARGGPWRGARSSSAASSRPPTPSDCGPQGSRRSIRRRISRSTASSARSFRRSRRASTRSGRPGAGHPPGPRHNRRANFPHAKLNKRA